MSVRCSWSQVSAFHHYRNLPMTSPISQYLHHLPNTLPTSSVLIHLFSHSYPMPPTPSCPCPPLSWHGPSGLLWLHSPVSLAMPPDQCLHWSRHSLCSFYTALLMAGLGLQRLHSERGPSVRRSPTPHPIGSRWAARGASFVKLPSCWHICLSYWIQVKE